MKIVRDKDEFLKFIQKDEGKRGLLLAFKGESNSTWFSIFFWIFAFIFTRTIPGAGSYNPKVLRRITANYAARLESGRIAHFDIECVLNAILDLQSTFHAKEHSWWSRNSSAQISRARVLQRALCYRDAIAGHTPELERDSDNSFLGALKGGAFGLFGGIAAFVIGVGIFWLVIMLIGAFI